MRGKVEYLSVAIVSFLMGLLLLGCQSAKLADVNVTPEPVCEVAGIVEQGMIEETSRGYPYRYSIYIPPCYDADTEEMYPVLYLLPGRSGSPEDWFNAGVNEVADNAIMSGEILPFFIVTTEDINSEPMLETIYNDLIPHIENNYAISKERELRAAAGGSLGSVGAYRLVLQFPDQFATVGMFGGGLIHGEEERVQAWLADVTPETSPRFFFNSGEQDTYMVERSKIMIDMLDEWQVAHTEIFNAGDHSYGYWVSNFPAYFEWLAQNWEGQTG